MPCVPRPLHKTLLALLAALLLVLAASTSTAAAALPGAKVSTQQFAQPATYPGIQHLHYEFGPIDIVPGQNTIDFRGNKLKPSVPGYITSFKPNLIYSSSRKIPRVDVIHLHHGVWIMDDYPTMAAGEEKTTFEAPPALPYHYIAIDP